MGRHRILSLLSATGESSSQSIGWRQNPQDVQLCDAVSQPFQKNKGFPASARWGLIILVSAYSWFGVWEARIHWSKELVRTHYWKTTNMHDFHDLVMWVWGHLADSIECISKQYINKSCSSNHTVQVHHWLYELNHIIRGSRASKSHILKWKLLRFCDFKLAKKLQFFSFFCKYLSCNTKIMDFLRVQGGMEVFQLSYQVFVERS